MASVAPQTAVSTRKPKSHQRPSLLTIPRELRHKIIAPLLQSGDLSILCVCPAITEEALQRIKYEATFRVNFGINGRENTVLGRASIPAGIQNVEIRCHLPLEYSSESVDALRSSSIRHLGWYHYSTMGRCTITVEYDGGEGETLETLNIRTIFVPLLSYALSGYTQFNTVGIKVVRGGSRDTSYWNSSPQRRLCMDASDLKVLNKRMMPGLGPAEFINHGESGSLEFHPRAHVKRRSEPSIVALLSSLAFEDCEMF
ncbi:MAG: hypothetical protein ALECFALPRED_003418 [Alectoria fallacina]|uniref:Uncharacterized protein n=1 Tax=Alectoria fallacina TaxID=1903189 RepID=A0A8H3FKK3_9LECA|nr:MAG: hypothetical protein ALECFALPRED_003418 [Alectoria fallacina]